MNLIIEPYERAGKIEGYSYLIEREGKVFATGYYRLKKHAIWWGNKALELAKESESER